MTSLADAFEGEVRSVAGRKRRAVGSGLVTVGALAVVLAVPIATTGLGDLLGLSEFGARELAGVLAGLGVPAVLVGIFAVLPASRATRATAAIGASLCGFGTALFVSAYPMHWLGSNPSLAVFTLLVYGTGALLTVWSLFLALATFNRRQDPGGTARMRVTEEGRLELIADTAEHVGRGAVGLFGRGPDGTVPTQTAGTTGTSQPNRDRGEIIEQEPTADGAGAVADGAEASLQEAVAERGRPDRYCGNCAHFEYVRADGDLAPYCGLHDTVMEDMTACEEWTANTNPGA
ncbi:MAG: hypothetical protein ABEH64_11290 [Salinirussus sp.]